MSTVHVVLEYVAVGFAWLCVALVVAPLVGAFIAFGQPEKCLMCELEPAECECVR